MLVKALKFDEAKSVLNKKIKFIKHLTKSELNEIISILEAQKYEE